jgi:hypothetical protein
VPIVNATTKSAKDGLGIMTKQETTIKLNTPTLEILIGGPYTVNGEEHTYGHVALRVITQTDEHIYDFGRYNGETGPFGQGRLRVWTLFSKYIVSENATGRVTTGFIYRISQAAAEKVNSHYSRLIGGRHVLRAYGDYMKEYRLADDYHALNNNCATTSMSGVREVITDLDFNVSKYNEGGGMSSAERFAAKVSGWPSTIFMPADLQKMLEENPQHHPDNTERFGGGK